MQEIKAELNYFRVAPRKVRLLADLIRGKMVSRAIQELEFTPKGSSLAIIKLLKSAVANAKHNFRLDSGDDLYIKEIMVNEGPTLKRFMPRARGSASPIRKRTSHIKVILSEKSRLKTKRLEAKS